MEDSDGDGIVDVISVFGGDAAKQALAKVPGAGQVGLMMKIINLIRSFFV